MYYLNDLVVKRELRPWEVHLRSHSWGHVLLQKNLISSLYINNPPSSPSPPPLSRQEVKSNPVLSLSLRNSPPSLFTQQRSKLFLTTSTIRPCNKMSTPLTLACEKSWIRWTKLRNTWPFVGNHIFGYQLYALFFHQLKQPQDSSLFFHKLVPVSFPALSHFFLTVAP